MYQNNTNPPLLAFQSDAGVDQSINRLQIKLALVALFKKLDLENLLVIQCAPNGSAYDKIERAMSPLNSGLLNVATKRKPMDEWEEKAMKNCSSMGDVRTKANVLLQIQEAAIAHVAVLH